MSGAGDWLYVAALTAYVLDHTGSATWIAAVTILRFLPHLLFGAIGGVIADRYPRRTVMLASDIARFLLMLVLAALASVGAPVVALMAMSFLVTTAGVPYFPSVAASTPAIVGERDLAAANSAIRTVDHLTVAVGPAVGSILLIVGSEGLAFAVNALTFLASAALVRRLGPSRAADPQRESGSIRAQLSEGWQAVTSSEGVALLLGPFAAVAFTVGTAFVLLPLVAESMLAAGSDGVGFLFAAVGAGGLVAAAGTGRLANTSRPSLVLLAAVFISGSALMLLSQVRLSAFAYLLMAAAGAGNIVLNVVAVTLLQRVLPGHLIGRVFGILNSVAVACLALGSLVAPFLVERFGLGTTLLIVGSLAPLVTIPIAPRFRSLDERAALRIRVLAPRVARLRELAVFTGAPDVALESIAASLVEEKVEPGALLIEEGDEADDFFVVLEGAFEVTTHGDRGRAATKVRDLGGGDYFGEIGLMTGMPRTASVRATAPSVVFRIRGEIFVAVVDADPSVAGALHESAFARLVATHPERAAELDDKSSEESHISPPSGVQ